MHGTVALWCFRFFRQNSPLFPAIAVNQALRNSASPIKFYVRWRHLLAGAIMIEVFWDRGVPFQMTAVALALLLFWSVVIAVLFYWL